MRKTTSSRNTTTKNKSAKWTRSTKGVYKVGNRYAVRVQVNGIRTYKSFELRRDAVNYYNNNKITTTNNRTPIGF